MNDTCIAVFVFARADHTKKTLESLFACDGINRINVRIFCDGSRTGKDDENVNNVRSVVREYKKLGNVEIFERDNNIGLAENIIDGINNCFDDFNKIIVLEDDMVVSKYFLKYMTSALDIYEENKDVWHVSAWSYPANTLKKQDVYIWGVMNCWGWGTWRDRWEKFDRNPKRLMKEWTLGKKIKFDVYGTHRFWKQVEENYKGVRKTWAVFWYATIFENNGLCVNFRIPLVNNIGVDGSGENCDDFNPYDRIYEGRYIDIDYPKNPKVSKKMVLLCVLFRMRFLFKKAKIKIIEKIKNKK